jgi:hypothetical protein
VILLLLTRALTQRFWTGNKPGHPKSRHIFSHPLVPVPHGYWGAWVTCVYTNSHPPWPPPLSQGRLICFFAELCGAVFVYFRLCVVSACSDAVKCNCTLNRTYWHRNLRTMRNFLKLFRHWDRQSPEPCLQLRIAHAVWRVTHAYFSGSYNSEFTERFLFKTKGCIASIEMGRRLWGFRGLYRSDIRLVTFDPANQH